MSAAALRPETEAALQAQVARAARDGTRLRLQGGGSKSAMLRPVTGAETLTTADHAGITLHAPQELVFAARAGTPLTTVAAALAACGQHLIAEPPDLSALFGTTGAGPTLGGAVATNFSGPRRVLAGALRDHVLGLRAIDGRGDLLRSGGRVLKNVTGLDLCKLLTGSHGTLALITEITLKVLPAPEASGTLLLAALPPARAVAALAAALGSPWPPSGAAFLPPEAAARLGLDGSATLCRIEDFAQFTPYRLHRLQQHLAPFAAGRLLAQAESEALWRAIRDAAPLPAAPEAAIWRLSVRPAAAPALAEGLAAGLGARYFLDWGGGLVWLAAPASPASHEAVMRAAQAAGGTWMLLRAPAALRASVAVLPPEPAALAPIARRVKQVFDPAGLFNPGHLHPGL